MVLILKPITKVGVIIFSLLACTLIMAFGGYNTSMENDLFGQVKIFGHVKSLYYIDATGRVVINASEYLDASSFSEGLAVVNVKVGYGSRKGFIDKLGKLVIEPKFYQAGNFSDGLAVVKLRERSFFDSTGGDVWGYIDTSGRVIIEGDYDAAYDFSEGTAVVRKGDSLFFIDKTGRKLVSIDTREIRLEYSGNQKFSDGLIVACQVSTEKCGFIDKTARFVIEPKFQDASNFVEGFARVSIKTDHREYLGFIDRDGRYVIPPTFDIDSDFRRCTSDFSEGLAALIEAPSMSNFIYIDRSGKVVLRTKYFLAEPFSEGLATVYDSKTDKYGFINKSGELVLPLQYNSADSFSDGLALVQTW